MPRVAHCQLRRFLANISLVVLLAPLSPALAQQKPLAALSRSQAQLEDRVKELEARVDAAEQKAASAAMEKDYITRVQKQYETYYDKVLSTQTWTLTVFGFILTALFALAAKLSVDIFDSRTKSALDAAVAQLEKKFSEQMQKELKILRQQNTTGLKVLEDDLTKRIGELEQNLQARADFGHVSVQGLAFGIAGQHASARSDFRSALEICRDGKPKQLIDKETGAAVAENIFLSIKKEDQTNFLENAKKELANELYNDLEEELALVAVDLNWLAPLLRKRKAPAPPATGGGQ